MFRKTKKFLLASTCSLLLLCVVIFLWVSIYMSARSEDAISEIGMIYMSEMSRQLQQKFDAVVSLRVSQVEEIARSVWPEDKKSDEFREKLAENAEVRGFTYQIGRAHV